MKRTGQELWRKAKGIIPGGNQLLSKRAERFLPDLWPAYYKRARGCEVWDLDGNRYYDFAQMGVGSCVLGYADPDVNAAVEACIKNGSMCSLNCHEEVELAEMLVALHPWSEMVRFTRTGGEACATAIRIARAATGKDGIAFCGYHGWHDWYLASNLGNGSNLDGQLLPGLDPLGVPRKLIDTAHPFHYNAVSELAAIVEKYDGEIGTIIMEPRREVEPHDGFLQRVREIADKAGAVLIFDEVTSGFRMNMGGIHLTYDVKPDIAIFGKALGNGYPISAVVGKSSIMKSAQDSFISSTFWSERIGYVAAIATLQKMARESVQERLVEYGVRINRGWDELSNEYGIPVQISGIPPLTHLSFVDEERIVMQTYYAQEMLKRGYLLGASVYTTYAYSDDVIDGFLRHSGEVFRNMKKLKEKGGLRRELSGDVIQTGFKRLTQ